MLCWLLDEPRAEELLAHLAGAELVLASCLTLVECDRALNRAAAAGLISEASAAERRALLASAAGHWIVFDLDRDLVERARRPFPAEPIRTLDAVHLATAGLAHSLVPDLAVLSLDERVRRSAAGMGLRVLP